MTQGKALGHGGMLAIWSDVEPDALTDYLHWLTREHTEERVSTPGFLGVRVFRAEQPGVGRFLILYDLVSPAVLASPAYLARLNDPTAWSQRIMPRLGNFARGGGTVVAAAGHGQGGFVAALRLDHPHVETGLVATPAAEDRICGVRLLAVDAVGTGVETAEKSLRSGDSSFQGLLLIEALDVAALRAVLAIHRPSFDALGVGPEPPAVHAVIFALTRAELDTAGRTAAWPVHSFATS